MTGSINVLQSARELREQLGVLRAEGASIALVPTLGALHDGHLSLIKAASKRAEVVCVSIFLNPTQFAPGEDFAAYPRDLEGDLELAQSAGASLCFAPSTEEMYPGGEPRVTVDPGPLATVLEGASRPQHFRGVATVVAKLFSLFSPDMSFFGEKDYQQLLIVTQLARDLSFATEVIGLPTVREPDGLALSSRNKRLDAAQRQVAPVLYRALQTGSALAAAGEDLEVVEGAMIEIATSEPGVELDYAVLRDATSLTMPEPSTTKQRVLIAARIGPVRLIDNLGVGT